MKPKMVACQSCAALFDPALVHCPYCGSGYAPAEEDEYMGQLEAIRQDLEKGVEEGEEHLKLRLGRMAGRALLTAAVLVLLAACIFWLSGLRQRSRARERKAEFLMEQGITIQQESAE